MSSDDVWQPLLRALDRWNRAGRRAEFWLRDDDAIEPTEPLDRLLDLFERDPAAAKDVAARLEPQVVIFPASPDDGALMDRLRRLAQG